MTGIVLRWAIIALGLWLASALVPGFRIEGTGTLILAALLLGLTNAVVRPVLVVLTLPLTIITLGLFLFLLNAALLGFVAYLLEGFTISGFFAALFGWLIVSLTSTLASWTIGPKGRYQVLVVKRGHR